MLLLSFFVSFLTTLENDENSSPRQDCKDATKQVFHDCSNYINHAENSLLNQELEVCSSNFYGTTVYKKNLESLRVDHCQLKKEWTLLNKNLHAKNYKIRKEFDDLDNFINLERIIISGVVRCINYGVHA
ncbi:20503_t:CDS:2 [Gigaspora margarita]|uniref:20503_t:CDS:1 n=1 Tax=Gigaspora margarita TaxID=4874 RepID=A0ABN7URD1_GIGMA|nr:20503_t:CDS:2 [Gigaspora margarita]